MITDLECGCRQEHDESGEMPVTLVEQCAPAEMIEMLQQAYDRTVPS
jgi:hypothetical protein